jgi:hypothetical protein
MFRVIAVLLTVAALAAIVFSSSAGAATETCIASSPKVSGGIVTGILNSSNVNKVQARFATCGHAKKVMKKALGLGLEEPRSVKAFYCKPTVLATKPADAVKYVCTFKGADTPMFVKLTFNVVYKHS